MQKYMLKLVVYLAVQKWVGRLIRLQIRCECCGLLIEGATVIVCQGHDVGTSWLAWLADRGEHSIDFVRHELTDHMTTVKWSYW